MNEIEMVVNMAKAGLKMAGDAVPSAEAVLVPLSIVISAVVAFNALMPLLEAEERARDTPMSSPRWEIIGS
jgi:hypothetical protein